MAEVYRWTLPDRKFAGIFEDGLATGTPAGNLLPANGTWDAPEYLHGYWPCRNQEDTAWEQALDHRGKQGYLDGQPHTIKEVGPLPDGWSDEPSPPTPEELTQKRRRELMARMAALDSKSIRPLRAIADSSSTEYDRTKLANIETQLADLQAELATL